MIAAHSKHGNYNKIMKNMVKYGISDIGGPLDVPIYLSKVGTYGSYGRFEEFGRGRIAFPVR